ncbi:putative nucleotide binding protein [Hibiscus syriacus]|uniref:Nucleotide binding protein n=1 Tax=Hibiscus syriacus TaxID=106335 RepID=A0A6A2XBY5_HIBSY|nr:WD repeat-containing protein WDS homolog [Hibiscus syriacus]KAE8673103.1 putative nucleotide binding protein [Hibiscus syriacus]
MENSPTTLGSKGLINKHEFLRVIIQCLYSFGYNKSASCLEIESGIRYKSAEFDLLESQILSGDWDDCIDTVNKIKDVKDDTRSSVLFLVFKQCFMEYLNRGDDSLVLSVLQKQVPTLNMSKETVHKLAYNILSFKEMGKIDEDVISELRKRLVMELRKQLPPPIVLPERRLEHLVETSVTAQIDSCIYHNSRDAVSLYEDHCCGRDQIPTETVQILTAHSNEVWFIQFSNNGEYLASSSSDCTAIIWKVRDNDKLTMKHTLRSHQNPVSFVAWSPDDTKLLTCGNLEVLKLWDVETGTCKHTFGDHGFTVSSCAWFPDSKRIVCGSSDPEKGICMWDCDGTEMKAWRGMRMPKVLDLAVTSDGENLISIFSDKEIRILNLRTNAEQVILEEHSITSLSVSMDSEFFIVNLNSQEIHLRDVAGKWAKPLKYTGHKQNKYVIRSCFGGINSMFIASGSENTQVYIWNRQRSTPVEVLSGHSMTVNSVSWNPKRPLMLASASDDHTIRIWGPSQSNKKIQSAETFT